MKRKAERLLIRNMFMREANSLYDESSDNSRLSTNQQTKPEDIAKRRIVRLKLPSEILAERQEQVIKQPPVKPQPAVGLLIPTQSNIVPPQKLNQNITQTTSLLGKTIVPSKIDQNKTQNEPQVNLPEKSPEANEVTGIKQGDIENNQPDNKPKTNLFSSLLQKSQISLGMTPSEEKKEDQDKSSLLNSGFNSKPLVAPLINQGMGNLFSQSSQNSTGSLFGSVLSGSKSTFANIQGKEGPIIGGTGLNEIKEVPEENKMAEEKPSGLFGSSKLSSSGLMGSGNISLQGKSGGLFGNNLKEKSNEPSSGGQPNIFANLEKSQTSTTSDSKPFSGLAQNINTTKENPPKEQQSNLGGLQAEQKPIFGNLLANQASKEGPGFLFSSLNKPQSTPNESMIDYKTITGFNKSQSEDLSKDKVQETKPNNFEGFKGLQNNTSESSKPSVIGLIMKATEETPKEKSQETQSTPVMSLERQKSSSDKPQSLFSGFNTNTKGGPIFGAPVGKETSQEKPSENKPNLFGSFLKSKSDDSAETKPAIANLFGSQSKEMAKSDITKEVKTVSSGLFGSQNKELAGLKDNAVEAKPVIANLFGNQNKEAVKNDSPETKSDSGKLFGSKSQDLSGIKRDSSTEAKSNFSNMFASQTKDATKENPQGTKSNMFGGFGAFQKNNSTENVQGVKNNNSTEPKPTFANMSESQNKDIPTEQPQETKPNMFGGFGAFQKNNSPEKQSQETKPNMFGGFGAFQKNNSPEKQPQETKSSMFGGFGALQKNNSPETKSSSFFGMATKTSFASTEQAKPPEKEFKTTGEAGIPPLSSSNSSNLSKEKPSDNKPNLFGSLLAGKSETSAENKPIATGLFGNQNKNQTVEKSQDTTPNLFGGLAGLQKVNSSDNTSKEKTTDNKPNLLGSFLTGKTDTSSENKPTATTTAGGLFGSQNKDKTADKSQETKPALFSIGAGLPKVTSNDGKSSFSNLFSSQQKEAPKDKPQETKPAETSSASEPKSEQNKFPPSIFATTKTDEKPASGSEAPKPSFNVIGSSAPNKQLFGGLFTGQQVSFTSALPTQSSGLFGKPKGAEDEGSGGEDDGDDDEPERSPSPEADITKSKGSYQYEYDYEKIISKKVNKLKPGAKDMLLEGEVSLNKSKDGKSYFIIYRNKAKLAQYQGSIVPKVSTVEYLNPRHDAISVIAYSNDKTTDQSKPKLSKDTVRMMFATSDDCNQMKKEIEKVISG